MPFLDEPVAVNRPAAPQPAVAALIAELRRHGIVDQRLLEVMSQIPRALFVPATFADLAWDNIALPIGHGQTISQPLIVAEMTAALDLSARNSVLEIGTGCGYQAAILSRLCRRVFTIERHKELLHEAERRFAQLRIGNITTRFGDGSKGWREPAPFDRIIVTAAAPSVPNALLDLLAEDGIMVVPVGEEWRDQQLMRVRRSGSSMQTEILSAVRFVPLVPGLPRRQRRTATGGTNPSEPGGQ